jgi:hypothetical protein
VSSKPTFWNTVVPLALYMAVWIKAISEPGSINVWLWNSFIKLLRRNVNNIDFIIMFTLVFDCWTMFVIVAVTVLLVHDANENKVF